VRVEKGSASDRRPEEKKIGDQANVLQSHGFFGTGHGQQQVVLQNRTAFHGAHGQFLRAR
jgi:hypothetical protein